MVDKTLQSIEGKKEQTLEKYVKYAILTHQCQIHDIEGSCELAKKYEEEYGFFLY